MSLCYNVIVFVSTLNDCQYGVVQRIKKLAVLLEPYVLRDSDIDADKPQVTDSNDQYQLHTTAAVSWSLVITHDTIRHGVIHNHNQ